MPATRYALTTLFEAITIVAIFLAVPPLRSIGTILLGVVGFLALLMLVQWPVYHLLRQYRSNDDYRTV